MKIFNFNIFYKVLLFSIVTLISTALIGGVTARLIYDTKFHSRPDSFVKYIGERISSYGIESKETDRVLEDIERLFYLKTGIYDSKGNLLKGDSSFLPLKMDKEPTHSERLQLIFGKTLGLMKEFKMNGRSYFLFMSAIDKHKLLKSVVVLLTVILIIILVAYKFSITLIKPLSKINKTVESFGKGDFTARAELCRKDEIGELAKTFNNMADKINSLMKSEKELIANVSHEIRTPLSRIKIALEISEEVESIDQIKNHLAGINSDLIELEQLIEDVLTSTKLDFAMNHENGTSMVLRKEPTDYIEITNTSIDRFRLLYPERELESCFDQDSYKVDIDKKLIKRVLDNLLDNAVKYSSDKIILNVFSDKSHLYTEIIDKGTGISEDDIENIFNPFYRAEKSRSKSKGGIGLGLTLCKRIIKAHGEDISVESKRKETVFKFSLKLI